MDISPERVVSSANFMRGVDVGELLLQSSVYKVKRTGERTQPWGAPVFVVKLFDDLPFTYTNCDLLLKNSNIQDIMCLFTFMSNNLLTNMCGCIVLKADEKSTNKILT